MTPQLGKWIMAAGLILFVVGVIVYFSGSKLRWIGHLPGDIRIEKDNFRLYFPITTIILLSLLVNLIIRLINYLK